MYRKEHLRMRRFSVDVLGKRVRVAIVSRQIEEKLPFKEPEIIKVLDRWCVIETSNELLEAMIYTKILEIAGRCRLSRGEEDGGSISETGSH